MEARSLRVGDVVRLSRESSGASARAFRIDGVYEPTPDPLRFAQPKFEVRMHLPDLSSLVADPSDPGSLETVTAINVALTQPADAAPFARELAARLPGAVARPTSAPDDRTSTFVVLERFHLAIAIVTVVGSAVFLLALMVMLVEERRATVGILRLIGFTRRRILLQVFAEGRSSRSRALLRGALRACIRGVLQPVLPVALRHSAGLPADHAARGVAVGGHGDSTGHTGQPHRVVDALCGSSC
jgi:hypothetical protein